LKPSNGKFADNTTAFIGLGGNEGNRKLNIAEALMRIRAIPGINILAVSPLYETSPIEVAGGAFINAVAMINTSLDPHQLMNNLLGIESEMGRTRSESGPTSRNIDLDLLIYGHWVIQEKDLSLPHPRMTERRFVLEPLVDVAPNLLIPNTDQTVTQAAEALREEFPEQEVVKIGNLEEFHHYGLTEEVRERP
jgi:2-amino-4-hydroxy-6-hydroxymethyldihydropteridine diphosphokinase